MAMENRIMQNLQQACFAVATVTKLESVDTRFVNELQPGILCKAVEYRNTSIATEAKQFMEKIKLHFLRKSSPDPPLSN
jgi:hypothetical protein